MRIDGALREIVGELSKAIHDKCEVKKMRIDGALREIYLCGKSSFRNVKNREYVGLN
jgi:hypothetical protein